MSIHTNIIAAYLSGNITPEDQRALNDWLKDNETNRLEFQKVKRYWEASQSFKKKHVYDSDSAWQDFVEHKLNKKRDNKYGFLKIAVSLILLFLAFHLVRLMFFEVTESKAPVESFIETTLTAEPAQEVTMFALYAEDSVRMFILPDRSRVYLNKNSSLQYPENFMAAERTTYLSGEAFFEVMHDSVPFVVNCGGIKTRVLGTSFWLRSAKDDKVEVSVSSGSVEVECKDNNAPKVVVGTNEKIRYSPGAPNFTREKSDGKEHQWTKKMSLGKKIKRFIQKLTKKRKQ